MATHSSTLAWRIPWTEEPGGLQSTGSQSRTRLSDFTHSLTHSKKVERISTNNLIKITQHPDLFDCSVLFIPLD